MKSDFFNRTTMLPLAMLVYLAVVAWMARERLMNGEYLFYFGVIGGSLVIIALLYFVLRRRERLRRQWDKEEQYGTYDGDQKNEPTLTDHTQNDASSNP